MQTQEFKKRFEIPIPPARKVLDVSVATWQRLVALRLIEIQVAGNGRQKTNLESIERAHQHVEHGGRAAKK